jgi:hypothetical protein
MCVPNATSTIVRVHNPHEHWLNRPAEEGPKKLKRVALTRSFELPSKPITH